MIFYLGVVTAIEKNMGRHQVPSKQSTIKQLIK